MRRSTNPTPLSSPFMNPFGLSGRRMGELRATLCGLHAWAQPPAPELRTSIAIAGMWPVHGSSSRTALRGRPFPPGSPCTVLFVWDFEALQRMERTFAQQSNVLLRGESVFHPSVTSTSIKPRPVIFQEKATPPTQARRPARPSPGRQTGPSTRTPRSRAAGPPAPGGKAGPSPGQS